MLKQAYVGTMRGARTVARKTGLLGWLDAHASQRVPRWARSLFAIYDIDEMTRLDLPWWTFDAIDKTNGFLKARPAARVLEWGSGASTVWLGRRAGAVTSIEHDADWAPIVQQRIADMPHVTLLVVPPDAALSAERQYRSEKPGWQDRSFEAYVKAADAIPGLFDLIVVDGRARPACLKAAIPKLAPGGMILFDNSHRRPYRAAINACGLPFHRTTGLTACLPYPDETTLISAHP